VVVSLLELQDQLDEWIVVAAKPAATTGCATRSTPHECWNEVDATSVAIAGYIPVPLAADDYIGLLPIRRRKINSNGVKIGHRVYHSDEPGPL